MKDIKLDNLLKWRCIGPFRGGRVVAVSGDPVDPATFYFGACAGGVWKTTDGGTYWECVSDGFFNTSSVGALAVAPSDPNVIYAGTGETTIRIDVSHGDGVYKSTDAGRSWQHMGLEDTRHIGNIVVHPDDPDLVYVAALGHAFGPNKTRGVYRSKDGGKNWELVLHKSEKAGAVDISIDDQNPRILYATIWETYRSFWQISSGGPDSGLYRSMDGGDTWEELTSENGLPEGILGKMAVAASPARSGRVWALIEAVDGAGLYRSDNYGDKWEQVCDKGELYYRAWYFVHLTACTQDPDTIYVNDLRLWKSVDGGCNFTQIATPHGDNHDLWIDPNNARRMVQGNDGGACVSFNGGDSWSTLLNQPTAQLYHIAADNRYPYFVYATQQDNSSIAVPSHEPERGAIPWASNYQAGTGESGYIAVHPEDHNIVYVGAVGSSAGGGNSLQRYDHRTGQIRLIANWPELNTGLAASEMKYRFAWTYPIVISPHNPSVLYIGGNMVFRSIDEGESWQAISPDLTRADPETLRATGGPINRDALGAETYATVFTLAESPISEGLLWAGSDDGLIHFTRDAGENWQEVTPPDLPEWTMISIIEASPHDEATAYVAATRYKLDDYSPYLYKTTDHGQTWTRIDDGIREDDFTRVIREDPNRAGLLYAGTETGVYVSFNAGDSWQPLQLNLPVSPVHDLILKENDLIAGTHGRSIWILDDVTPLQQIQDDTTSAPAHLFQPRATVRARPKLFGWVGGAPGKNYNAAFTEITTFYEDKDPEGHYQRTFLDAGANPPNGVIVTYHLSEKPESLSLTFLDDEGNKINEFNKKPPKSDKKEDEETEENGKTYAPANAGMNRFIWNMRYEDGLKVKGDELPELAAHGPVVAPGPYQVRLQIGDQEWTQRFDVARDPRVAASDEDLEAQAAFLLEIRDKQTETHQAINTVRDLRQQVKGWLARTKDHEAIQEAGKNLLERLDQVESPLVAPGIKQPNKVLNTGTRLAAKLAGLPPVAFWADFRPTPASREVFQSLSQRIDVHLAEIQEVIEKDVPAFNHLVQDAGHGALAIASE